MVLLQTMIMNIIEFKYDKAIDLYTEALNCKVNNKKKAIYYCNRSLVHLKAENYGVALLGNKFYIINIKIDAIESVKLDETYEKAWYRRGSAHVAMNQFDMAVQDFK